MRWPTVKIIFPFPHGRIKKDRKLPVVEIRLERKGKEDVIVHIRQTHPYDGFKFTLVAPNPPSVVNPPWLQYFRGVDYDWMRKEKTDDRVKEAKREVWLSLRDRDGKDSRPVASKSEIKRIQSRIQEAFHQLDAISKRAA